MDKPKKKEPWKDNLDRLNCTYNNGDCDVLAYNQCYDELDAYWEAYHKEEMEIYKEIFEKYIPLEVMDKANFELVDRLTGGREKMGYDILKKER